MSRPSVWLAWHARRDGRRLPYSANAIAEYRPRPSQHRNFALSGVGRGDGTSIADVPEEELLEGFAG